MSAPFGRTRHLTYPLASPLHSRHPGPSTHISFSLTRCRRLDADTPCRRLRPHGWRRFVWCVGQLGPGIWKPGVDPRTSGLQVFRFSIPAPRHPGRDAGSQPQFVRLLFGLNGHWEIATRAAARLRIAAVRPLPTKIQRR